MLYIILAFLIGISLFGLTVFFNSYKSNKENIQNKKSNKEQKQKTSTKQSKHCYTKD